MLHIADLVYSQTLVTAFTGTNTTLSGNVSVAANVGVAGVSPATDAQLTLAAGTTTRAPLKFTSGPLLATPVAGTMEYLDHTAYFTTFLVRRSLQLNQDIVVTPVTVSNTVTETTIYSIEMATNYLTAGKVIVPKLGGVYWLNNPQTFTLRLKKGATTLVTTTSTAGNSTAKPWEVQFTATILSIGAGGTLTARARLIQDSTVNMDALTAPVSIDTTTTNTFKVTCEWSATGANSLQLNKGYTECVQ